jgi:hypothetical protein
MNFSLLKSNMARNLMLAGAIVALPALPATAFAAANVSTEMSTAATHAGLAAKASDIKTVHMHLHHALNCLVGPKGKGFDKNQLNPCANSGNGAIPDSANAAQKAKLKKAAKEAKAGLATTELDKAVKDAEAVAATIKKAM